MDRPQLCHGGPRRSGGGGGGSGGGGGDAPTAAVASLAIVMRPGVRSPADRCNKWPSAALEDYDIYIIYTKVCGGFETVASKRPDSWVP